ncbi:MAG: DUF2029 domain-containing protein [Propionibacteriaceae bacterium]|nr:DUF2029 domain-containing protein [Propionibacteriaceae bacterium]
MTRTERDLRRQAVIVGLTWTATRAFMVWDWWGSSQYIGSDVSYYFTQLGNPDATALVEYPTPILWLMRLIYFITQGSFDGFFNVVVTVMVLLDALVTAMLFWRASTLAAGNWVVFLALLGPIMWFRIDLIPAAAVTLGLLWLATRPRLGGALLAVGAATKIWPALLILPALGRSAQARRRGIGFGVAGASLALLSLVFNGWARSVSPITWQDRRGLQIESLSATWAMIRHANTGAVRVEYTAYHAYQVVGAGVSSAETVANWLMAGVILYAIAVAVLLALVPAVQDGGQAGDRPGLAFAIVLAAAATIAAMIAANKTFSPQYLIWLAGPLGLMVAGAQTRPQRRWAITTAVLGCIIAGLTQLLFPLNYSGLIANPGDPAITALLVTRNLLMAVLTLGLMVWAARNAWHVATLRR